MLDTLSASVTLCKADHDLVTYKDGMMKGSSVRWKMLDEETAQSMGLTYKKVGN